MTLKTEISEIRCVIFIILGIMSLYFAYSWLLLNNQFKSTDVNFIRKL